jgi:hypothetical protein
MASTHWNPRCIFLRFRAASLEVGRAAPDHHDRRLPLIASDTVRQFECRFVQIIVMLSRHGSHSQH